MPTTIVTWFHHLSARRGIALALGPGLLSIGVDAAVAHFAGKPMHSWAQLVPIVFAPAACVALLAASVPVARLRTYRRIVRAVGAIGVAVGVVGTGFHVRAFLRLLEGVPLTWREIDAALAVAPPLFAPGAFAAIGAVVWLLGSPRLSVHFQLGAPLGHVMTPSPLAQAA